MDQAATRSDVVPPEVSDPSADSRTARPRLVRLAYRFLWNHADAEDVAQEALLIAQQRTDRLRETGKWWSWVSRIVVNRCHERSRRRQRDARLGDALRQKARSSQEPIADSIAADAAAMKGAVRSALSALSKRQHEVIVLRHLHGMTYAEVGEVLGISEATARVHARAGREALRKLLLVRSPELFNRVAGQREANEGT